MQRVLSAQVVLRDTTSSHLLRQHVLPVVQMDTMQILQLIPVYYAIYPVLRVVLVLILNAQHANQIISSNLLPMKVLVYLRAQL